MRALRLTISIAVAGLILALPFGILQADFDYNQQLADGQFEGTAGTTGTADATDYLATTKESNNNNEWIIKWRSDYPQLLEEQATILDWLPDQHVTRIKLNDEINSNEWIIEWQDDPRIEYIHPNTFISISTLPDDRYYTEQYYLEQIKAQGVWKEKYAREIVIAVLDTGIDYNHPDLHDRVLPGYNILDNNATAMDDNGHGTNVAGIIAANSNNKIGISGITNNVKLLPIKILDGAGKSDSFYVGQGIRYAADHGANIIVIASGELVYTPFIAEAVDYAYENNVLIVAAAGNKSLEINYPAALPNVIAVGAVDRNDKHIDYSNFGQQLDVVAPGEAIYTTHLDNSYVAVSGTSFVAPQVAALAAVLMQKYPELTLKEISDLIRFSADDVGDYGWDEKTGYGRINFKAALNFNRDLLRDGYVPNQRSYQAHPFPRKSHFNAELTGYDVPDWFYLTLPYAGNLELQFIVGSQLNNDVTIELYTNEQIVDLQVDEIDVDWGLITEDDVVLIEPAYSWTLNQTETVAVELTAGKYYIKIVYSQPTDDPRAVLRTPLSYTLINEYSIYHDKYENNDRPWNAYEIRNISEVITATFSKRNDDDWYRIHIDKNGTLSAEIRVTSNRVDPVLYLQRMGSSGDLFDLNSSGKAEYGSVKVTPGDYLIRVYDYNGNVTNREYQLELFFEADSENELGPNNNAYQAKRLDRAVHVLTGTINSVDDYDWFSFVAEGRTYVEVELESAANVTMMLYDEQFNIIDKQEIAQFKQATIFDEGQNYIRISSQNAQNTKYNLKLKIIILQGNFIDISDHYAKEIIIEYYEQGLIQGYEDYTFRPDQAIKQIELIDFINKYNNIEISAEESAAMAENPNLQEPVTFQILSNTLADQFRTVKRTSINNILTQVNQVPYATISRAEALIAFDFVESMTNSATRTPAER